MNKGLVYIFTGEGKGKTSAALGTALRAIGHGKKVAMVQFYKTSKWGIGEHNVTVIARSAATCLPAGMARQSCFQIYPLGAGFYFPPKDKDKHQKAAQKALKLAEKLLSANNVTMQQCNNLFLLVLDEVLNAIHDNLIKLEDLRNLISKRGSIHIILTGSPRRSSAKEGRNCPQKLIDLADLVTEMKNIKHPFQKGQKAILGLDY